MKKNITIKIFAFLALFWIVISVVWTWILIFFWDTTPVENQNVFNSEEFQKMIDEWKIDISGSWETNTWELVWTGETK